MRSSLVVLVAVNISFCLRGIDSCIVVKHHDRLTQLVGQVCLINQYVANFLECDLICNLYVAAVTLSSLYSITDQSPGCLNFNFDLDSIIHSSPCTWWRNICANTAKPVDVAILFYFYFSLPPESNRRLWLERFTREARNHVTYIPLRVVISGRLADVLSVYFPFLDFIIKKAWKKKKKARIQDYLDEPFFDLSSVLHSSPSIFSSTLCQCGVIVLLLSQLKMKMKPNGVRKRL